MGIVHLNVNRREYTISCEDGEEQHLVNLSYELDQRVRDLSRVVGTGNQALLLVVSALQLLDEIYAARTGGAANTADIQEEANRLNNITINQLASKLEELADQIEKKTA